VPLRHRHQGNAIDTAPLAPVAWAQAMLFDLADDIGVGEVHEFHSRMLASARQVA
jgi:hypothetical protein